MNYQESVRRLLALGKELAAPRQPAQTLAAGARVQKFALDNIRALSEFLGSPHLAVPSAHIAGTNGKGSTAAFLESILRATRLKTGLFISPHLERINERIQLGGEPISDEEFAARFTRVQTAIETLLASGGLAAHPTYFECLTAMAFDAFSNAKVDLAVFETGLGGRLDSTNILRPQVTIITQVDFDHENYLGHSIAQIAREKVGIIKPGATVVSAAELPEAREIIARHAADVGSEFIEIDQAWRTQIHKAERGCYEVAASSRHFARDLNLRIPLAGRFQIRNALAAVTAALSLAARGMSISDEAIRTGIAQTRWPGRIERLQDSPIVYLDGTHNPAGARELLAFWKEHLSDRKIFLIYGSMRDKSVDEVAGLLYPVAHQVIVTQPGQSRAISASHLAEITSHFASSHRIVPNPSEALESALSDALAEDVIFVTGSLYLAGELRAYWRRRNEGLRETLPVKSKGC